MIQLQKCEAKLTVLGMMISSPEDVDSVLKTLEMKYGRPDLIIDELITEVKAVTPIKSWGYKEHLQNPTLVRDIVQKLLDMIKLRWEEEVMRKHGAVDLSDLSDWMSDIAIAACYVNRVLQISIKLSPAEH